MSQQAKEILMYTEGSESLYELLEYEEKQKIEEIKTEVENPALVTSKISDYFTDTKAVNHTVKNGVLIQTPNILNGMIIRFTGDDRKSQSEFIAEIISYCTDQRATKKVRDEMIDVEFDLALRE